MTIPGILSVYWKRLKLTGLIPHADTTPDSNRRTARYDTTIRWRYSLR
jgi:hypothetical protein